METTKHSGGSGVAFIYLLFWGIYGVLMAISLVFTLSHEWSKVTGADLYDVPPGIMVAGSIGGIIAVFLCALSGLSLFFLRKRQWDRKSVVLAGLLGPGLGIAGAVLGLFAKDPILLSVLFVGGMPIGVNLGRKLAHRKVRSQPETANQ